MDKNNSKTLNKRTHNSMDLYQESRINQNEEFSKDFDSKIDSKKNTASHSSPLTTKKRNKN